MSNLFLNDWNVLFVTELFPLGDKACDEESCIVFRILSIF